MIQMVRNSLIKFKEMHPKYNLFVPNGKIGSEHYILLQLRDELDPIEVIYGYKQEVTNDYPIIILDDAIYSSCNVCSHIDEMDWRKNRNNNFFVIVAVLSSNTVQVITDKYFNGTKVIADMTLTHLLAKNLFGDYDPNYFYKHFDCEVSDVVLPLFFEHKIANKFGSYQFYHKIVDKPISRKPIDDIKRADVEDFVKSFNL